MSSGPNEVREAMPPVTVMPRPVGGSVRVPDGGEDGGSDGAVGSRKTRIGGQRSAMLPRKLRRRAGSVRSTRSRMYEVPAGLGSGGVESGSRGSVFEATSQPSQ